MIAIARGRDRRAHRLCGAGRHRVPAASDLVRGELPRPSLTAGWLGLMTSILMLIGFALPPLLQLRSVPPARVLRRNLEPPPLRYASSTEALSPRLVALAGLAGARSQTARLRAGGDARHVRRADRCRLGAGPEPGPLRGSVGISWRYGMANIARRGRDSVIQIVAFGLGLMVLLLLAVVRNDLMQQWRASLPENAPNHFMINIRPDQTAAIGEFFAQQRRDAAGARADGPRAARRRSTAHAVAQLPAPSERGRDFLEREANLTWAQTMQQDNKLVAGEWWREGDGGGPRVSVEIELAQSLGLKIGDDAHLRRRRRDRRRQGRELPRGAVGLVPAELLHGVLAGHARRHQPARTSPACTFRASSARS